MKNKLILIALLFAVPLFFPFKASAGEEPTASELLNNECPPINVSGKALYDSDCVLRYFTSIQHTPQESAASPPQEQTVSENDEEVKLLRAEIANLQNHIQNLNTEIERGHETLSHAQKFQADFLSATESLNNSTAQLQQAENTIAQLQSQVQELTASRDQANVSLEEKEALIQAIRASHAQAIVALEANEAQIQDLTARLDQANVSLQATQEQTRTVTESRDQATVSLQQSQPQSHPNTEERFTIDQVREAVQNFTQPRTIDPSNHSILREYLIGMDRTTQDFECNTLADLYIEFPHENDCIVCDAIFSESLPKFDIRRCNPSPPLACHNASGRPREVERCQACLMSALHTCLEDPRNGPSDANIFQ